VIFSDQVISADGIRVPHTPSSNPSIIRLIILDRRAFIRECISACLRALPRNIEILRTACVADDLQADELARADIVLVCATLSPATNELAQREIASLLLNWPDLPLVLIADSNDADEAKHLVARWGLRGYIPTSSTLADVEAGLDMVLAGGTYLPVKRSSEPGNAPCDRIGGAKLTDRERAVLFFLREGMPNKIIAHRLGISQSTVKAHIHSILTKLGSRNRTEAAVLAGERFVGALSSD
jgi:DNA-binding NarL/FixJ family response regulator